MRNPIGVLHREIDRLSNQVKILTEEKELLQGEINNLTRSKKIKLPREVAEAIEREFGKASNDKKQCGFYSIVVCRSINLNHNAQVIKRYFHPDKYIDLATALAEGYTIEETKEERIKRGIQAIYNQWTREPSINDEEDGKDLGQRIYDLVKKELNL
ncbi:hypothetical protein NW801_13445 [Brevibacillus laterosporus]|uniref:Uncharacterized protein n=1 Tax=Brevibacillus halotolerans TaxID=1507437 RepID=A0ABT4HY94_9BACL|nr:MULTISPECIES: hypothetical protein [Brevibacillus]MCR8986027.1 hypothetical protein [Brevibacillus laterosporus]MCZ0831760.1 hypothetical protein [Brevibacillus halotolerans]